MRRRVRQRGATLLEAVIGVAALGVLALMIASMFRVSQVSYRRSSQEADILSNARKAMTGDGSFRGMILDGQYAYEVSSPSSSQLPLLDSVGAGTTYTLSSSGELSRASGGSSSVEAAGLTQLSMRYFARDSNYLISESTVPADARLVTVSFQMVRTGRTVPFYSGASLRNHE